MGNKVTIKDLAKILGIAPSTVARALKDHPDIGKETTKAVKELAEKMNYTPNLAALNFRNRKSNVIGIIVPEIVHHFFSCVIDGAEKIANKHGYNLAIFQSKESEEKEKQICEMILKSQLDGVMISMSKTTHNYNHFQMLKDKGIPLLFFDRICGAIDTDRVIVDDYEGAYNAVRHLISIGCKRIAHLAAPQTLQIGQKRQLGYIQALKDEKIPIDESLIIQCDNKDDALVVGRKLMQMEKPPCGVFAVNDMTAAGAMLSIKKMGYRVPQDVAVAGFTDGIVATLTDPTLTSVEQHGDVMGEKGAEMLIKRINSETPLPTKTEVVKTNLIVRQSTRR